MTVSTPRLSLRFALCAAALLAAAHAGAAEKSAKPAPTDAAPARTEATRSSDSVPADTAAPVEAAAPTSPPALLLPKFEVTATRLREIDVTIKRLEKQLAREKKQLEKSNVDEALNSEKISRAAALFGGKSTVQRASVAAVRIESIEKELGLLDTLRTPLTAEDRALIEQLVKEQRIYRRELDIALR